ncbi:PREDICTED: uncharacterized protein LOC106819053, partial [Priapulus caudatus]|uniref:Uncharacterized protein LOC106819053 n=1 Tax=Priapulus caudatus TaxID=37621 RepID=A0ABM1F429_PRICU
MDYVSVMFVVQLVASVITAALAFDYSCYVCESSDLTSQGRSTGCPSYAACCQDPFQDAQHAVTMETSCRYCIKAKYSWKDRPDQYTNRYCYNDVNQDEEKQGPRLVNHLLGFQTQSSTEIL